MTDEIKVLTRLQAEQGDYASERAPGQISATWSGTKTNEGVIHLTTSWVDISYLQSGWVWVRNLSGGSATIDLGVVVASLTYKPVITLKAGETAVFRLSSTILEAKASESEVGLEYRILEN